MNIFHEYDLLASIAGGLPGTLPPEGDFINEKTRKYMEKYIMRNPAISAEKQHRLFRFIIRLDVFVLERHGAVCGRSRRRFTDNGEDWHKVEL